MPETCAVVAMIRYSQAADSCGWDMSAGYLFPEMPAAGDRIPKRLARPLSAKAMAARFKQHLEHWGRGTLPSMRLGCVAPSHRLSQVDIAEITVAVNWKLERLPAGMWEARQIRGTTPDRLLPY